LNHTYTKKVEYDTVKKVIEESTSVIKPSLEFDIYHFLLESIVSQQLSVKVATIIFGRFVDLFLV